MQEWVPRTWTMRINETTVYFLPQHGLCHSTNFKKTSHLQSNPMAKAESHEAAIFQEMETGVLGVTGLLAVTTTAVTTTTMTTVELPPHL